MDKKTLRKVFMEKRLTLSEAQYRVFNDAILQHVQKLEWRNIKTVHLFLPITEKREVDTWPILRWLQAEHPDINVLIPRANFTSGTLENILYTSELSITKNEYNISEPVGGTTCLPTAIDRVFVPLLCCDEQGHRLGYGKGFYDRFLNDCRADIEKIGLSFFEPIAEITATESHDIQLTNCITPNKTYRF